ncbi:MAG: hypothetical protein AAF597_02990, partial [Bacteroidota bacterium]
MTSLQNRLFGFVFVACLVGISFPVMAQTTTWEGDVNSSWFTAGNWTNGVPDITKEAIIEAVTPGNQNCVIAQFSGAAAR